MLGSPPGHQPRLRIQRSLAANRRPPVHGTAGSCGLRRMLEPPDSAERFRPGGSLDAIPRAVTAGQPGAVCHHVALDPCSQITRVTGSARCGSRPPAETGAAARVAGFRESRISGAPRTSARGVNCAPRSGCSYRNSKMIETFLTAYDPTDLPGTSIDPLGFEADYLLLADEILPGVANWPSP